MAEGACPSSSSAHAGFQPKQPRRVHCTRQRRGRHTCSLAGTVSLLLARTVHGGQAARRLGLAPKPLPADVTTRPCLEACPSPGRGNYRRQSPGRGARGTTPAHWRRHAASFHQVPTLVQHECTYAERWYGTKFSAGPLPDNWLQVGAVLCV